ncbi:MAG TPA: hypothetical protein VHD60_00395 [Candidatus Saccharimonadales bacterium]|nr:hypothetical protein [Candidatus Saccharimonadales bacterium]
MKKLLRQGLGRWKASIAAKRVDDILDELRFLRDHPAAHGLKLQVEARREKLLGELAGLLLHHPENIERAKDEFLHLSTR